MGVFQEGGEPPVEAEPTVGTEPTVEAEPSAGAESTGEPEAPARRRYVREYLETLLVAILIVLFVTTFIVQNSVIPSASMEQTLLIGDYLLVDRSIFAPADATSPARWLGQRSIRRGDVVVFRHPPDPRVDYIKRVIGLPGERVEIRNKQVYIDGVALDEPYKVHATGIVYPRDAPGSRGTRDNFGPVVVPEGEYFVLGDNRDYSADSREWRFVPRSHVTGRALFVFWSRQMRPGAWEHAGAQPSWSHFLKALKDFPHLTRWERIGRLVE